MMRTIQCALCGRSFTRISDTHTQKNHGISVKEYGKKYGPITPEEAMTKVSIRDGETSLFEAAAKGMSPEELSDIQASARLRIFSKNKRYASLYAVFGLMDRRMKHFEKSSELAEKVQAKLCDESWRLEMDENGKALSNEDLIDLGRYAQMDMKNIGEIFLRLLGQVVQDNKAVITRPGAVEHSAFTGEYDRIDIPNIPGHEREKVRIFMERLVFDVQRRAESGNPPELPNVIEGEVQSVTEAEES